MSLNKIYCGISHSFDVGIAASIGLNEAILFNHIKITQTEKFSKLYLLCCVDAYMEEKAFYKALKNLVKSGLLKENVLTGCLSLEVK